MLATTLYQLLVFLGILITPLVWVSSGDDLSVEELTRQLRTTDSAKKIKAIIALGNKGQTAKSAIPTLIDLLKRPDSSGKVHPEILRTVERIGLDVGYVPFLLKDLTTVGNERAMSCRLLGIMGEPALPVLLALLDDKNPKLRMSALMALFHNRNLPPAVIARVANCLDDPEMAVRFQAAGILGTIGPAAKESIPSLIKGVQNKNVLAAHALGSMRELAKDAVPILRVALADQVTKITVVVNDKSDIGKFVTKQYTLAEAAALSLGKIGPDAHLAVKDLLKATRDTRLEVRQTAVRALGNIKSLDALPGLLHLLVEKTKVSDRALRKDVALALGKMGEPAVPALLEALKEKNAFVREAAAIALGKVDRLPEKIVPALLQCLKESSDVTVRLAAIASLGSYGVAAEAAVPDLVAQFSAKFQNEYTRKIIMEALANIGEPAGPALLEAATKHEHLPTRKWSIVTLGKMKSPPAEVVPTLTKLLADTDLTIRLASATALGEFGAEAKSAIAALETRTKSDPSAGVRKAAGDALKKINNAK